MATVSPVESSAQEEPSREVGSWLTAAQGGCHDSIGRAVESCRQYLLLIADRELEPALRARGGASDLVQETMLVAQQHFGRFHGQSEGELRAWTRRILLNQLAQFRRQHYRTGKRTVGVEVPLEQHEDSAERAGGHTPPINQVIRSERLLALRQAVDQLPEHYRQAFLWRYQEGCSHETIGRRLGLSPEAARKLWVRIIERLQTHLGPYL